MSDNRTLAQLAEELARLRARLDAAERECDAAREWEDSYPRDGKKALSRRKVLQDVRAARDAITTNPGAADGT